MSEIHIERIKNALDKHFANLIDMSDVDEKFPEQSKSHFLSRALAAFCLMSVSGVDPDTAARSITDGFDDNGVDGILLDLSSSKLYVIQSKWINDGNGSPELGDLKKFLGGFGELVSARFERFNSKIQNRRAEITNALLDGNIRLVMIIAYSGTQGLSTHAKTELDEFLARFNDPVTVLSQEVFNQEAIYRIVSSGPEREGVCLEIGLKEWGSVDAPFRAYYGQVPLDDVRNWWMEHGERLFARNLRGYKGRTDVNESLTTTLTTEPERFWYFNNGITLLAKTVVKKPIGGPDRSYAVFECSGVSVVNGAQTVGVIGAVGSDKPGTTHNGQVLVRLVSLEECPDGFDDMITRSTNTQNRIERHDFAALDPNQQRIAREMWMDGRIYSYKAGDKEPAHEDGCTILHATVALACAEVDASLAVMAKTGTGRFFDDLKSQPYLTLFNDTTSASHVWRAVRVMHTLDRKLTEFAKEDYPRSEMVAVHGNRFMLHRVFRDPLISCFRKDGADLEAMLATIGSVAEREFKNLCADLEQHHTNSYLASLFKNFTKCRDLDQRLDDVVTRGQGPAASDQSQPQLGLGI